MPFFTAPKFLSMPAVGFDISADALRFIELGTRDHNKLMVARYATRNFPLGTVMEGRVRDRKKLQEVITLLSNDYKLSFANVSLPEEQAYLANMKIPRVEPSEIPGAIELRLEEHVPISIADAIFDYVIIGEETNRRKEMLDVVVSAFPRAIIDEYLDIFHDTGIVPQAFEFKSQAMARALIPQGDNGTFLVVDIGKVATDIFVCANGVVQFSASLDIGGYYITQSIAKALNIKYDEAEELKVKYGLVKNEARQDLHEAIMAIAADLRMRLMRHYQYWQTHHGEKVGGNIECVYLTGGSANLKGITEYIAAGLDVKVSIANPWTNVCSFEEYIPPLTMNEAHGYTAAIGLALRNTDASTNAS